MAENPFASYQIEVPKKYSDGIKKFVKMGGGNISYEYQPFERQVDLWYAGFLYAVSNDLEPTAEKNTSNITPASILSTHSFRIDHIQMAFLGKHQDINLLAEHRKVFEYALQMANTGIPYILQLLNDIDEMPLMSMLDEVESELNKLSAN
jgi:hypothetical protein